MFFDVLDVSLDGGLALGGWERERFSDVEIDGF